MSRDRQVAAIRPVVERLLATKGGGGYAGDLSGDWCRRILEALDASEAEFRREVLAPQPGQAEYRDGNQRRDIATWDAYQPREDLS